MNAKYQGHCQYCPEPIEIGDEITKGNGGRHAFYSHVRCVPTAGITRRAGFIAIVTVADEHGWIPVGTKKQYVHEGPARATAQSWRNLGATVEVRPL